MKLHFLGAAGTVTGSRYLVEHSGTRVLVDCGLFQGVKVIRNRNWKPLPVDASTIDAVVLTHAHLDHSGYLPRLRREGFTGKVYCTQATQELAEILLKDSAHLQEEDARHANRHGYSKHDTAEPLYTAEDAERVLKQLQSVDYHQSFSIGALRFRLTPAGHILGSACVRVEDGSVSLTFSGDVGRPHDLVMQPPAALEKTDYLVVESTYGDRRHPAEDPWTTLADIVTATIAKGGTVMMPAFAVGRAQMLTFLLTEMMTTGKLPHMPIFLDSPMAINVAGVFCRHPDQHRLTPEQCETMCGKVTYVRTAQESQALSRNHHPKVIIAGAGMLTGGRILHHLKAMGGGDRNTLVIAGYQAEGTRGDALLRGTDSLRIYGEEVSIRCRVVQMESLSAHADYQEILDWLSPLPAPRRTFVTHGESLAADALRQKLEHQMKWPATVPEHGESFELT